MCEEEEWKPLVAADKLVSFKSSDYSISNKFDIAHSDEGDYLGCTFEQGSIIDSGTQSGGGTVFCESGSSIKCRVSALAQELNQCNLADADMLTSQSFPQWRAVATCPLV